MGMGQRAEGEGNLRIFIPLLAFLTMIQRKFRFEDLEIWQIAIEIGDKLYDYNTVQNE